jgi:D-alanyl-lipoteichoic acid acyltransferase DltB (MBOAT superfamily)
LTLFLHPLNSALDMNFAQARFWGLLLAGLAVIGLLRLLAGRVFGFKHEVFDKVALFGLGLFLLLCVSRVTFVIFLVVAIGTYVGLQWILKQDESRRRRYLYVLIPLQLLPLAYYKYGHFALNDVLGLDVSIFRNLVIPVGISFYTFQKVAFVVDTLVFRQPLPRFLDFLNFAGFFPQIVAGPIERRRDLLPQMEQFRLRWSAGDINQGATWVMLGLFLKLCLADNLTLYFDGSSTSNAYLIWLANILFGLRIYYDFAGYSLIAVGLARCLGVKLTLNFLSPYCSASMVEFWRRWHVTLSQWFRDYVYIPMGGGRVRWWAFNVAVVFVVSGIWHGAGWNFALWGAVHGLALCANRTLGPKLKMPAFAGWLLTMLTAFGAWLCFYETRTGVLMAKMKTLVNPGAYNLAALRACTPVFRSANGLVLICFLGLTATTLFFEWLSVARHNEPYYFLRQPAALMALAILTVMLSPDKSNGFIYFAF